MTRLPSPKIVYVLTSSAAVASFLRGQIGYHRAAGFEVTVVSSPGRAAEATAVREGARFLPVRIDREIRPLADLRAFWQLWRLIRHLRPDLVHVGTPKAGFLGGLAAWLAGVPCRVYTLYGLRLETAKGWRRWMLALTERISCRLAHRVLCVSHSLRRRAAELGLTDPRRCWVPGNGSPNGVDSTRFTAASQGACQARRVRERLGIPQTAPVIGFVGRLTCDKGICELAESFCNLQDAYPELRLLLVGPWESGDPVPEATQRLIGSDRRILMTGFVTDPSRYYRVMDLLALPTHREGFPTVVIEAGAAARPVVATLATGVTDAVVDGETGLLTPVGDVAALTNAIARLLDNPALARQLGCAGRERARRLFQAEPLWEAIAALYRELLAGQVGRIPAAARARSMAKSLP